MEYKVIGKFICCGSAMVTVIMNAAVCVMTEHEYNRIVRR